jgi:hypothetical protein
MRNEQIFDSCFDAYQRIWRTNGRARSINPERLGDGGSSPQSLPRASDYLADFALLGRRALDHHELSGYLARLFVRHYLRLEDGEAVRKSFVVSPQTFDAWRDLIRKRVGGAFRRGGLWPRQRYFRIHGESAMRRFLAEVEACE